MSTSQQFNSSDDEISIVIDGTLADLTILPNQLPNLKSPNSLESVNYDDGTNAAMSNSFNRLSGQLLANKLSISPTEPPAIPFNHKSTTTSFNFGLQ